MELTVNEIVVTLTGIGRALDERAAEVERLDAAWVQAKAAYETAFSRAFLTAQGPIDVRREQARFDTREERFAMDSAEQVLRAGKESLRVLRDRLDIGRSLGALVRAEAAL